jgi:acetyltransferase-like isoleucine patch superfamily enzyme
MDMFQQYKTRFKQQLRRSLIARLTPIVESIVVPQLQAIAAAQQAELTDRLSQEHLSPTIQAIINTEIRIFGDRERLHLAPTAEMVNTLFNLSSGEIYVGDYSFTGHNVSLITGTHDYDAQLQDRTTAIPLTGRDITIGQGVWIGSNAVILGPCTIGDHAVIAAGAVVTAGSQIPAGTIVAGVPAKVIKPITR